MEVRRLGRPMGREDATGSETLGGARAGREEPEVAGPFGGLATGSGAVEQSRREIGLTLGRWRSSNGGP